MTVTTITQAPRLLRMVTLQWCYCFQSYKKKSPPNQRISMCLSGDLPRCSFFQSSTILSLIIKRLNSFLVTVHVVHIIVEYTILLYTCDIEIYFSSSTWQNYMSTKQSKILRRCDYTNASMNFESCWQVKQKQKQINNPLRHGSHD